MALPPSSPRLPSPPPPAEIQIGPKSPLMGPNATRQAAQIEQTAIDTNAKRRIHRGTKSADMAAGPPLVPLHELDSAFQLQEHLAALHYYHTSSHTSPMTREAAGLLATPPPNIDKTLWLYELCRFLISQCNSLIVGFLFDTPPCSAQTCPEMRASEWQFLCAVHDAPKSCCAIDYCCHTLDWAANVVTNPKIFPSRFVVDAHDKNTALKNLINVFRRLHRIFAHAWFQHRGVFWNVEGQTGLYVFFKTVCDIYDLLPAENYKLPPEAEGLDSSAGNGAGDGSSDRRQQQHQQPVAPISIVRPPSQRADLDDPSISRTNTRRHIKSSPSTGSAVTTVPEADEDDGSDLSSRLGQMRISARPAPADEELELANIPVIVENRPLASGEQLTRPSSVIPPPGSSVSGELVSESDPAAEVSMEGIEATGPEPRSDLSSGPASHVEPSLEPKAETETEQTQPATTAETQQAAEQTIDNSAKEAEQGEKQARETTSVATAETGEAGKDSRMNKTEGTASKQAAAEKEPGPAPSTLAEQDKQGGDMAGTAEASPAGEVESAATKDDGEQEEEQGTKERDDKAD
ncbi:hypothetical protein MFIFM68171_09143 [Madurella fahalii]|uniref:Uncharacterized protein n=1 Tax=Madurella fahalii TaxID=1157608 RepID=A0ABQ0GMF0_9PEZI